ncbi:thiol-disulfide oxidoreductase ResA [Bacillus sp. AFS040349]|uniref:thiol-disulfide oxidoreductase ResA n=1 Tax=Bacillus sp. AFS040349 TaxID=2033502 RepID=UPI000BFE6D70|nr:thiol-disulfide oxidoreductase ResA [Bacillus sp. AFS040349]PGT79576.1 thiol-disulfide oxidoreductase [Bacillus sp. AFS040349]
MQKKRRLIVRAGILIGFVAVIAYILYTNFFNNDNGLITEGDIAPDFQLQTLDGETVRLSDYKGQGVFLNFWATYCPPCKEEMPYMQNQYEEFKDKGVTILAIDVGEPKLTVEKFVKRHGLTFPILLDQNEDVLDSYGVGPIPVTFLIDKDGKVVDRITAGLTEEDIKKYLTRIMP